MKSDLELKYHKGQEFIKTNAPHVHCIIDDYFPADDSYLVTYLCSGHIRKVPESVLKSRYQKASAGDKQEAIERLCQSMGAKGHLDEDGVPAKPR